MDAVLLSIKLAGLYGLVGMYYAAPFVFAGLLFPFVTPWHSKMGACIWVVMGGGLLKGWLSPVTFDPMCGPLWLSIIAGLLWIYYRWARIFFYKNLLGLAIAIIGTLLMFHYFEGFQPIWDLKPAVIKAHSTSISFSVWPVGPILAILILTFFPFQRASFHQWSQSIAFGLISAVVLASILMPFALYVGSVDWQPGFPEWFTLWAIRNLIFTCIVEEVFYRLFLQRFLQEIAFRYRIPWYVALAGASVLFGMRHTGGGIAYIVFASTAGLFYGWVFHKTERIEASIISHFTFNTLHALLFTYPFLAH